MSSNRLLPEELLSSSSSPASHFKSRSPVCECHCNCPALVCPPSAPAAPLLYRHAGGDGFRISGDAGRRATHIIVLLAASTLISLMK